MATPNEDLCGFSHLLQTNTSNLVTTPSLQFIIHQHTVIWRYISRDRGLKLTAHVHLVQRPRIRGATPPLPVLHHCVVVNQLQEKLFISRFVKIRQWIEKWERGGGNIHNKSTFLPLKKNCNLNWSPTNYAKKRPEFRHLRAGVCYVYEPQVSENWKSTAV